MVNISGRNYSLGTNQSEYRAVNRGGGNNSKDTYKTKVAGNTVYIEDTSAGNDGNWNKIPGKYALKEDGYIAYIYNGPGSEYKLFYAAESTDERPVMVAKGVDEYGMYFEEKIDVKNINPYNMNRIELDALSYCKPEERGMMSTPYSCMAGQRERELRERFNYVGGAQTLIKAWSRNGYAGQAAQWNAELNFVLGYTENTARAIGAEEDYKVNTDLYTSISEENKRNMELYCSAARERMAAGIAKRCSEELLDLL